MLPFENKVASYLEKDADNKVLYRVTPIFEGKNLLCSGVQMEALSLNDNGKAIKFNVYCYNCQPGIDIDYATGKSSLSKTWQEDIKKAVGAKSVKGSPKAETNSTKKKVSTQKKTESPKGKKATETVKAPEPAQPQASSETAWLSATGNKYHSKSNCGRMNPDKATQTTVSDSQAAGYERCSKCW